MSSLGNNVMIEKHAEQVGWNTSDLAYTMICREAISLVLDHPTILLLVSKDIFTSIPMQETGLD